ncbi:MAG: hypothetical protein IPH68_09750 [Chitinophagaceae bacterium]|nr:hypothetical protein [Chitinophagaceae bacterium]
MNTGKKITQARSRYGCRNQCCERLLLDESLDNSVSVDNNNLRRSALDSVDADGDPVNENSFNLTGEDLDIPGSELDDEAEETGAEDEENNGYSRADTE